MLRTKSCTQLFIAILFTIKKKWKQLKVYQLKNGQQNVVNPYNGMKKWRTDNLPQHG